MTEQTIGAAAMSAPRPLINRYRPMRLFLIAYAIGEAGLVVMNSAEYYFRNVRSTDPFDEGTLGMTFSLGFAVAGLLQLVGLLVSFVLVSLWTFRAMKNLHLSGAREVSMSPGWAVGWYFIPFANLWKPFEGMLQIWRGSLAQAGQDVKVASYVGWWWATWIISNIISNISVRLSGFIEEGPNYDAGLMLSIIASVLSVPCTLFLLRTTRVITEAQQTGGRASVAEAFS
ncbi:MAG: DUF4328 domain-containing protein [Hyphomonas sp.]